MEVKELAHNCAKAVDKTMRVNIPLETCPLRKQKAEWKKREVVKILILELQKKYNIEPDAIR